MTSGAGDGVLGSPTILVAHAAVPAHTVELIIGEAGLSFSGGELVIWKRTVVLAGGTRYVARGSVAENALWFNEWLAACPQALGIRPDGSLQLPRLTPDNESDPLHTLGGALEAARRVLTSQVLRAFLWAGATLAGAIAAIGVVISYNMAHPEQPGLFRVGVAGIVLVVAACLLAGRGLMLFARRGRLLRVLRELTLRGELNAEALAAAVGPTGPPAMTGRNAAAPPAPAVGLVAATLSILATILMLCPYVGLVLAAIALALTWRKPSWARSLAIASAVVNLLVSGFVLVMSRR